MSATIKAIRDMNFKKHAVLVSHVGKSCYVDAFHISSIVSWKVTQPGSMVCQKHAFKQRKNNSVLVFMFRPCCKSTLPKSHKLQVQRICCCWTPHISPWFQPGRHGSLKWLQSPENMPAPHFVLSCMGGRVAQGEAGPCH